MADKSLVLHICNLARLEFVGEELERFGEQFEKIVRFIERIDELQTDDFEPMISPLDEPVVLREDVPGETLGQGDALRNAPRKVDGQFVVPRVID